MVVDSLDNLLSYVSLHPRFELAFDFIRQLDFSKLKPGRIVVDDDIYINVDEVPLRPLEGARYETHDDYIDIQIPITAGETIVYAKRIALGAPVEVHKDKDIAFVEGADHVFKVPAVYKDRGFGDTEQTLYNYLADWLSAGRFD